VPEQRSSLIAGRLVPRECVTWSNHELTEGGFKPVTSNLNIPRTEIECFYENGEEVRPTAQQILNLQAAILEDKANRVRLSVFSLKVRKPLIGTCNSWERLSLLMCVFDCTYVSRRVAHYDDEVRHR
jgi:hypothetical protein